MKFSCPKPVFLLIGSLLFTSALVAQQDDITFNILNGDFQRCAEDSLVQIEIIPNPNLTFSTITLVWNEDVTVTITDDSDLIQSYTFPISELLDGCDYPGGCLDPSLLGECFDIDVFASYTDGSNENNGRIIAFQKPPEPAIDINGGPYCEGEEISLTNNTCPGNDPEMTYLWVLPDGSTTTDFETTFILNNTGPQTISLTATNSCGSNTTTRTIDVVGLPDVNAVIDTGAFEISPSTYRVCLEGSGADVLFTSPGTINTNNYQWTWTGGGVIPNGSTTNDSLSVTFTQAGTFTFTLTGSNGCSTDDVAMVTVEVVESEALTLNAQPDVCPELNYTPSPLDPDATYEVDGMMFAVSDFPVLLTARATPYVVIARKDTECLDFELMDEFFVDAPIQPNITSPADGNSYCPDTTFIDLIVDASGGTWTPDPALVINGDQAAFDLSAGADDYTFTYTLGTGACERTISINLTINSQVISLPPDFQICQTGAPEPLAINPIGGTLSGIGVNDPMVYEFDPDGLAVGNYTLVYEFDNAATGCREIGSFTAEVVAEPTLEVGPPIQLCNTSSSLLIQDQAAFVFTPANANFSYSGGGIVNPTTGAYIPANLAVGTVDTVVVTYENIPGCLTRDTLLVEITGIVMPNAGPDTTICGSGNSFSLGDPQGGCWSGPNAVCDGTVNISSLSPGNYTYTLTFDEGGLCESSDTRQVTIVPGDGVGLAFDQLFICDTAATVSLPNSTPIGGMWSGGLPINGTDIDVSGQASGDYTFTYLVSSLPEGCNAEEFTLSILPRPVVGLTADSLGCANVDCLNFEATGDIADAYQWIFDDGNSSSSATTCHTYTMAGDYDVSLTAYRLNPVSGDAICTSPTVNTQLTILEPPPAVGIQSSLDTVCPGQVVDFSRLNPDDSEYLTFVWNAGFGLDTVADLGAVTFPSPAEDTVYTIYLQTLNQCGTIVDSFDLVVRANPVARIGVVYAQPCSGADLILTNLGTGTIDNSLWTTSDGDQFTSFQPPVLNPLTDSMSRELLVQLVVSNVCRMDTIQTSVTIEPTDVRALPSFTDTTVCFGTPFEVTNNSTPDADYSLVFSDGNVYSQDTVQHLFSAPGNYQFTVYATGCGYDSSNWHVRVLELPSLEVTADPVICPFEVFDYNLSGDGVAFGLNLADVDSVDMNVGQFTFPFVDTTLNLQATTFSNEGCRRDSAFSLQILSQPNAIASVSDSVCAGSPVSLNSLDPSGVNCRWNFGDGSIDDGCSVSHIYQESGLYQSQLIVTSALGCTDTIQTPVFVEFTPDAAFELDYDADDCGPVAVDISTLTNPDLASSYFYDLGDGNSSSLPNFEHIYYQGGEITITLNVGWNGVCFDEVSQTIDLKKRPFVETLLTDERCNPSDFARLDVLTEDPTDMSILDGPRVIQNGIDRFEFNTPGQYDWVVTSEDGCDTSGFFFLPEKGSLIIRAVPDYAAIQLGDSVRVQVVHNIQDLIWTWTQPQFLSDTTSENTVITPDFTNTYFVTATDSTGCFAQDTIFIEVEFKEPVFVPSAFTPNDDGVNDFMWLFMKPGVSEISSFQIFDRWGEMVYNLTNPSPYAPEGIRTWDGKLNGKSLNPQVLVYQLVYLDRRGIKGVIKGDITLLD